MAKDSAREWFVAPVPEPKAEEIPVVYYGAVTMESHLAELARIRDEALNAGYFSAAVTAEIARAKHSGIVKADTAAVVRHEFGVSAATLELLRGIRGERVVIDRGVIYAD